jgi:hypothetical protein
MADLSAGMSCQSDQERDGDVVGLMAGSGSRRNQNPNRSVRGEAVADDPPGVLLAHPLGSAELREHVESVADASRVGRPAQLRGEIEGCPAASAVEFGDRTPALVRVDVLCVENSPDQFAVSEPLQVVENWWIGHGSGR